MGRHAQPSVPVGHAEAGRLTLDAALRRRLSLLGLGWFFVCLVASCAVTAGRPVEFSIGLRSLWVLLAVPVVIVATVIVHEAVHGVFLWAFTGARPAFGVTLSYAYANAPGWIFTRGSFTVCGLAPAVLLTVAGGWLYFLLPMPAALLALLAAFVNLVGSVGDLYLLGQVAKLPRAAVVEDRLDGFVWYLPR